MKIVFYTLLTAYGRKDYPSPTLLSVSLYKSFHSVCVLDHTGAQCMCVVQAAAKSPGEKFASSGQGPLSA